MCSSHRVLPHSHQDRSQQLLCTAFLPPRQQNQYPHAEQSGGVGVKGARKETTVTPHGLLSVCAIQFFLII
ncbi:hypothetical protein OIU77_021356 [Salix suchowensis]|uniref:Uncharacterized protein n=1 Tax=Salix suchowensis TaxID=1278906 RepID=A0ABQ9CDG4_9ROSI|nr:hypothetical protein OIU77_021356 [Salix suchowensis]